MRQLILLIFIFCFTKVLAQKDTLENATYNKCILSLEQRPEFIDGDAGLMRFLRDNLHPLPDTVSYGMAVINFTVDTSGNLADINFKRKSGSIFFDEECLRVVKLMSVGKWLPGKIQGKKISTKFNLPFRVCFE